MKILPIIPLIFLFATMSCTATIRTSVVEEPKATITNQTKPTFIIEPTLPKASIQSPATTMPYPTALPTNTAFPTVELPAYLQRNWVAFISVQEMGIYIARADGSEMKNVIKDQAADFVGSSPAWSPDGHQLAFIYAKRFDTDWNDKCFQIMTIGIDGKDLHQMTDEMDDCSRSPNWSPNGKSIVYASESFLEKKWIVDIKLRNADGNTPQFLVKNGFRNDYPIWSRDGKTIYYISNKPNGQLNHLMAIDSDGKNERLVKDLPGKYNFLNSISPDGKRLLIYVDTTDPKTCMNLAVLSLPDGALASYFNPVFAQADGSWSPDPRYIVLNAGTRDCRFGGMDAYIMDMQTKAMTRILRYLKLAPEYPSFSPVPALQIENQYRLTEFGDRINLRKSPFLSAKIIRQLQTSETVTILEGPVDTDGYYWWRMRTADGVEGWAVEVAGWYAPLEQPGTSTVTPAP